MVALQTDRIDGLFASLAVKAPCKVVATTNIAFVGSAPYGYKTINGVSVTDNVGTGADADRVLLTGQTDLKQNGIWRVSSLAWTRTQDFDGARDAVQGTLVPVYDTVNGNTFWQLTTANPIVFGTSLIAFQGLSLTGSGSGGLSLRTVTNTSGSKSIAQSDHQGWVKIKGDNGSFDLNFAHGTLPNMETTVFRKDDGVNAAEVRIMDGAVVIVTLSDDTSITLKDAGSSIIPKPLEVST